MKTKSFVTLNEIFPVRIVPALGVSWSIVTVKSVTGPTFCFILLSTVLFTFSYLEDIEIKS